MGGHGQSSWRGVSRWLAPLGVVLLAVVLAAALATPALALESFDAFNAKTLTEVREGREVPTHGVFKTTKVYDTSNYTLLLDESPEFIGCEATTTEGNHYYAGVKSAWMQLLPQGSGQLNFKLTWEQAGYVPMVKLLKPVPNLGEAPPFASLVGVMKNAACLAHEEEGVPIKNQILAENGVKEWHVTIGEPGKEPIDIQTLSICAFPKTGLPPPEACDKEHEASVVGGLTELEIEFIPDDSDSDGIPDAEDHCKSEPAAGSEIPITTHGCPDTDKDGIPDNDPFEGIKDSCPAEKGPPSANGCPDDDEDGLRNTEDHCPNQFSLTTNGCRDSDNDTVPDLDLVTHIEDHCRTERGLPATNGCPDSDGDGVPDRDPIAHIEDQCKTLPGPATFEGCPDSDGDRVPDNRDSCAHEWANIAISQALTGRLGCVAPLNAALHYLFGRATPRKQLLRYFNVEAPIDARVTITCHGRECPRRSLPARFTVTRRVMPMIGYLRHGKLRQGRSVWIPVGTTISATVTDTGTLGRRRTLAPTRTGEPKVTDQCLAGAKVVKCA